MIYRRSERDCVSIHISSRNSRNDGRELAVKSTEQVFPIYAPSRHRALSALIHPHKLLETLSRKAMITNWKLYRVSSSHNNFTENRAPPNLQTRTQRLWSNVHPLDASRNVQQLVQRTVQQNFTCLPWKPGRL